jgi:hypothetical protein
MGRIHSGAHEYQTSRFRHSDWGFKTTMVSSLERGAGSVAVSARPALPRTWSTSGNRRRMVSVVESSLCASPMDMPGMVLGMYKSEPSSTRGINSDPMRNATGIVNSTR